MSYKPIFGSFAHRLLQTAICAVSLLACLAMSGCAGNRLNTTERMMWSTYPLATQTGAATGFVVARRDAAAAGGITPIVFTSSHVFATMGKAAIG